MTKEINLNHICKIEGHAHLALKIEHNKVKKCELKAAEGARFFEALVLNKKIEDVQEIVSRICGICSSAHSVCCIQALEEALEIKPSEQQKAIRELLMIGERIRSHITHLYFMALPDYYNVESALQLGEKHQDKINNALALITLGNKIVECVGGREIHPFLSIKENLKQQEIKEFSELIKELKEKKDLIKKTINLFSSLKQENLERDADYLSLYSKDYVTISGKVKSASGLINDEDYKKHLHENIKEYATSKFVLKDGKPYVVGAIARLNNNKEFFDNETKQYLKKLKFPLNNPFDNNLAQAIELLYLTNRVIWLLENFNNFKKERTGEIKLREGHAVSAVEAPRGTLFHEYKISKQGVVEYCNIITPTCQNLNMMEIDIKHLVDNLLAKHESKDKIVLDIEKLIRAYDPCFSCSTHFLRVDWD